MNIREISKPITAKGLNESLAKKFGQRLNSEEFTLGQLQDAQNKLRTSLSQVETKESFNSTQNPAYQKSKLFLDVLNAEISERADIDEPMIESTLTEGEEDKAELVMAAKDMVDRVTGWMEDTAEMQTESMLELADGMDDLGGDMEPTDELEPGVDEPVDGMDDMGDDFGADGAAAGGEEEAGREKRESVQRSKKKLK